MKKKTYYAGKGRIQDIVKGPQELYDFFWSLTKKIEFNEDKSLNDDLRTKVHHFLIHVFYSMESKIRKKDIELELDEEGLVYSPIYCRLIEKNFTRELKPIFLRNQNLIKLQGANKLQHLSAHYALPRHIWDEAKRIEHQFIKDSWASLTNGKVKEFACVNLVDGKPIKSVNKSTITQKLHRFATPKTIKRSIEALSPCVFNPKHAGWYINQLGRVYKKEKLKFEKMQESSKYAPARLGLLKKKLESLEKKYQNERISQRTILYQQPKKIKRKTTEDEPLYKYQIAYKPQRSGRLTEKGGGLQNSSRIFKALMFKNIETNKNYDLQASQANILKQELEKCGFDSSWITTYMNTKSAKDVYAKKVGVSASTWKKCLYSTIMGSVPHLKGSSVIAALESELGRGNAAQALKQYNEVAKDLIKACKEWRDYIISPDSCYTYKSRKDGYKHWSSASGTKHKVYALDRNNILVDFESVVEHRQNPKKPIKHIQKKNTAKVKRQLAAFVLQGQEAHFIHHLTALSASKEIKVRVNEHDGLICNKNIPENLTREAAELSGLPSAKLEPKPLASDKDIEKAEKLIERDIPLLKKKKAATSTW